MKPVQITPTSTLLHALVARLREAAQRFNPSLENAPAAVLWTDEREEWAGVLPQLQLALPELFCLGPLSPAARCGPGVWLRMVADRQAGKLPAGQVPLLYLPGVANASLRTDLRALKDDPQLAPLAELQYRGVFWRQENGKDWTLRAFFESKRHGLSLGSHVKADHDTLGALKRALPKLLGRSLQTLADRAIDHAFLNEILHPNPADDVLRWLADPAAVQAEKGADWPSFATTSKQRYGLDLGLGVSSAAARVLAARESDAAFALWEKLVLRPDEAVALYEVFKVVPKPDLLSGAERYPAENEVDEQTLAQALSDVARLDAITAAAQLIDLDTQHAPRRATLWAQMNKAPLAQVLLPLATVARALLQPVAGGTVAHQAALWAADGWRVDAAALAALALGQAAHREAEVESALAAVYRPWLERAAQAFQQRVRSDGYPARGVDSVPAGTVVLFVDGLRLDLARQVESTLLAAGRLTTDLQHRFTSVPSVTSSGKVWCSPGFAAAQHHDATATTSAAGFEPTLRVAGSDAAYTAERLRRAIAEQGVALLDLENLALFPAAGVAWVEFRNDIDADGHNKGLRLAEEAPRHLAELARTIQRLLYAGWQRVRVVTDHGWLLVPGGLPKVELPVALTETKWSRCAVLKDAAPSADAQVLAWSYGPHVRIALAPGIGAFRAGHVFDHGGLTLQESVVPVLDVMAAAVTSGSGPSAAPALTAVSWNTRKSICTVLATHADGLALTLLRLGSAIGEPATIDAAGKGRIVFDEVDEWMSVAVTVVLSREGQAVTEVNLIFGESWHEA